MIVLALALFMQEWPVEVDLPAGWDITKPVVLRSESGAEIPGQIAGRKAVFLVKNVESTFTLATSETKTRARAECGDSGKSLVLRVGDRKALQFNYSPVEQPDPVFTRGGYFHPVWTPSGKVMTNDSPKNHLHHHGIWSAWTSSQYDGRRSNFWESAEKQGRVEHVAVSDLISGPVFAGFTEKLKYVNLNGPEGPVTVLEELWQVRLYAIADRFVFDLTSTQSCTTDKPLVIKEYRYGGIGFRGPADWEGKAGVKYLTSEGKDRVSGHATKAKWVHAWGKVGGVDASMGFLCHPDDFRFPQPLRIHPDEPFFNWAVPQGGDFAIEPGKPYVARYRFIAADGVLEPAELDAAWSSYGQPSKVKVVVPR